MRLMSIFVEFYTTMLGFVNFRLYHNLNLIYPPTLVTSISSTMMKFGTDEDTGTEKGLLNLNEQEEEIAKDRVAALNQSLARSITSDDENFELDDIPTVSDGESNKIAEATEEAKKEIEDLKKLQKLFKSLKIFLNREVPREPLVLMVRAFGGQVSWDSTVSPGATFSEEDPGITHQICDRPRDTIKIQHIGKLGTSGGLGSTKKY